MAKFFENGLFDKNGVFKKSTQLSALALSDFLSSSTKLPNSYPLNKYPYTIYKSAWESRVPLYQEKETLKVELDGESGSKFWWWQPNHDSIPVEFLEYSSMHGLKYLSQPKRHLVERIFWFGAFIACISGAVVMISEIWQRYYTNPVIVTFNPTEQDLDAVPFPAVTICNMSPFRKTRVDDFVKNYVQAKSAKEREDALDALRVINGICTSQESFLKIVKFASTRGEMVLPEARDTPSLELEKNLTRFLLENTQPCRELVRRCVWGQEERDCGRIFKPIISDFGKCCTFNMLPPDLMEHYQLIQQHNDGYFAVCSGTQQRRMGENRTSTPAWTQEELDEWSKWNFGEDGYVISKDIRYPRRQRRAGTTDGLTVLIDPDVENSFCASTDSLGVKVLLHDPLDAPRVADLGSLVGVDQEVYLEVNPDLTVADDGIATFGHETRKCYFGTEYKLQFYKPYTRSNCLEECWSEILIQNCSCVLYYIPRNTSTPVCATNPGTKEYQCVQEVEQKFLGRLHKMCAHCKYSCNDLQYNAEITYAPLQKKDILWGGGYNGTGEELEWMKHRLSVVHVFNGADSTVPKLRQKLYQTVDLIANTGGLLGLSIGFSVLSAVEVIYFSTMRVCFRRMQKEDSLA